VGGGAGYKVDLSAGYAAGTKTIHLDTGTGALVQGDVISVTDDPSGSKYVVLTGATGDGDKDIVLAQPGLMGAIVNDKDVTIAAAYRANLAFSRNAMVLATRAPAMPTAGDLAIDAVTITDQASGLSFEVRQYAQFAQVQYLVMLAWGVRLVKPEHCAILLG